MNTIVHWVVAPCGRLLWRPPPDGEIIANPQTGDRIEELRAINISERPATVEIFRRDNKIAVVAFEDGLRVAYARISNGTREIIGDNSAWLSFDESEVA